MRIAAIAAAVLTLVSAAGAASISGGTRAQRRLASEILARLAPTRIRSVTFGPSHFRRTPGEEIDVKGFDGSIRTDWEDKLFAASFVLASRQLGVKAPRSVLTDEKGFPSAGISPAVPAQPRRAALRRYLRSFRSAAGRAQAQVVFLRVLRPWPVAVAITLRVSDPAAFLKHRSLKLIDLFERRPAGLYGAYLGLEDSNRAVVWAVERLPNEGGYYVRPDLYSCSPFGTLAPPRSPPPCPA